jgi:hypothetical protein
MPPGEALFLRARNPGREALLSHGEKNLKNRGKEKPKNRKILGMNSSKKP